MYKIYREGDYRISLGEHKADFTDSTARGLFDEGLQCFRTNNLESGDFVQQGQHAYIFPWLGDRTAGTLSALLLLEGFKVGSFAGVIEVENATIAEVKQSLSSIIRKGLPTGTQLAESIPEKHLEKYDEFLPITLLAQEYALRAFDVEQTSRWLNKRLASQ